MSILGFVFQVPGKLMFGEGLARDAGREARALGATKALIITDEGVKSAGLLNDVEKSLEENNVELVGIFSEIPPNSEIETCEKLARFASERGADILISVGGGSAIDTAKASNILLTYGGDLLEDWQGTLIIPGPLRKHIAIPTTAGTGSEVSIGAVIKNAENSEKISFGSEYLVPDVAILDPLMTVSLPPALTASTGIDALAHAVESFSSSVHSPISDAVCFSAVRMIYENLPVAFEDGSNLDARGAMLVAASMGGFGFSTVKSIGACHAMAHAVGGLTNVPHGLANAIILPVVMKYNLDFCTDRYAELARAMDPTLQGEERFLAEKACEMVEDFIRGFGIPSSLKEAGVESELAEKLAEEAMVDVQIYGNPRPATIEEILELFKSLL